jgi:Zn-dependent peptidase ImmA (M78 family)
MMNKGKNAAIKLRGEIGIRDPFEIPLEDVIIGRGGIVQYKPMGNTDGRIVYGKNLSTIFINSDIKYEGRKMFALAHELGHLEMHKGSPLHDDNVSLDWFDNTEKKLKKGSQEYEANQFASEYLMPSNLFYDAAKEKKFSPGLIKDLAERFKTSLTSAAFKYFEMGLHPIVMFHVFNGKIKYWKKSEDLWVWITDRSNLSPPDDSVAMEYIEAKYKPIYKSEELMQVISKSTYFELREHDDDTDFYEYCIVTESFKNILSIVWEK